MFGGQHEGAGRTVREQARLSPEGAGAVGQPASCSWQISISMMFSRQRAMVGESAAARRMGSNAVVT